MLTTAPASEVAGLVMPAFDGKKADQGSFIIGWLPLNSERKPVVAYSRFMQRMEEGFGLTFKRGRVTFQFPVAEKTRQEIRLEAGRIAQAILEELEYDTSCIN